MISIKCFRALCESTKNVGMLFEVKVGVVGCC